MSLKKILLLVFGLAFAAVSGWAEEPSPQEKLPEQNPSAIFPGGYSRLSQEFHSYTFEAKREFRVTQEGMTKTRWDQVQVTRNEMGHLHFIKTSSFPKGDLEFYGVSGKVYRPDIQEVYDRLSAKAIFLPVLERSSNFWDDFWKSFSHDFTWKKEGGAKWQGRICERYTLSTVQEYSESRDIGEVEDTEDETETKKNTNPSQTIPAKIKGDILVDEKTGLVLKSEITAEYVKSQPAFVDEDLPKMTPSPPKKLPEDSEKIAGEEMSPEPAKPYILQIVLNEKWLDINENPSITIPKEFEQILNPQTTSLVKEKPAKPETKPRK